MSSSAALAHPEPWTVAEWLELNEQGDGNRYELLEGGLLVSPSPSYEHQYAADSILVALRAAAPADLRVVSAVAVELQAGETGMIPDVVVVRHKTGRRLTPLPVSAVVLAVEVVSPSTRRKDRQVKPAEYAAAGIPAYWRLETANFRGLGSDRLPVLFVYALDGDEYRLTHRIAAGTPAKLDVPFSLEVDPAHWAEPEVGD